MAVMGNPYKHRPILFRKIPMHHLKYQLRQSQGISGFGTLGRAFDRCDFVKGGLILRSTVTASGRSAPALFACCA